RSVDPQTALEHANNVNGTWVPDYSATSNAAWQRDAAGDQNVFNSNTDALTHVSNSELNANSTFNSDLSNTSAINNFDATHLNSQSNGDPACMRDNPPDMSVLPGSMGALGAEPAQPMALDPLNAGKAQMVDITAGGAQAALSMDMHSGAAADAMANS